MSALRTFPVGAKQAMLLRADASAQKKALPFAMMRPTADGLRHDRLRFVCGFRDAGPADPTPEVH